MTSSIRHRRPDAQFRRRAWAAESVRSRRLAWLYSAGLEAVGNGFEWETQNTNAANEFYGVLDDNATKVKGKHKIQFGFHYRFDQLDILPAQQQVAGNNNFATNATSLYDPGSSRTNPQALPYTGDDLAKFYLESPTTRTSTSAGCSTPEPRSLPDMSRISTESRRASP